MPRPPVELHELTCTPEQAASRIAENWQSVRAHIDSLSGNSGGGGRAVRIIGVSKYVCAEITSWLVRAGCLDLGENRPQALWEKAQWMLDHADQLGPHHQGPTWHQIGHLQRNKVRRVLKSEPIIHSIDSKRLLDQVHHEARSQGISITVLLEINVSGEAAKTGMPPDSLLPLLDHWRQQADNDPANEQQASEGGAKLVGLMAMAGWGTDPAAAQQQFAALRELRDQAEAVSGWNLPELSMGMSGDYEAAIAEGSTMVRIGSKLFSGVLPE